MKQSALINPADPAIGNPADFSKLIRIGRPQSKIRVEGRLNASR